MLTFGSPFKKPCEMFRLDAVLPEHEDGRQFATLDCAAQRPFVECDRRLSNRFREGEKSIHVAIMGPPHERVKGQNRRKSPLFSHARYLAKVAVIGSIPMSRSILKPRRFKRLRRDRVTRPDLSVVNVCACA
jgi:hypothetical protein